MRRSKITLAITTGLLTLLASRSLAAPIAPSDLLKELTANNDSLKAKELAAHAAGRQVSAEAAPENPELGLMRETNVYQGMNKVNSMLTLSISQKVIWPTKYGLTRDMQRSKANILNEELRTEKLKLRGEALNLYFKIYVTAKTSEFLKAERALVGDIAKSSEVKRATGDTSQQDEMIAHIEQTKLEMEIIVANEELAALSRELAALLGRKEWDNTPLTPDNLTHPSLKTDPEKLVAIDLDSASKSRLRNAMVGEASALNSLAQVAYYPDFMLKYSRPVGADAGMSSESYEIGLSIPLWFALKESHAAEARKLELESAEKMLSSEQKALRMEQQNLAAKIKALGKLLKIYDTSLLPAASSALSTARINYGSGKGSLKDFLAAERLLYGEKIEYFKNIEKYIVAIIALESLLGRSISDLPFEGVSEV